MMEVLNHLSTLLLLSLLPPSLSEVVNSFDPKCNHFFLESTTPSLPGILVGGTVQGQNRYKPICQKYKNSYRFATLYDTTNKIPVFSAYTFTGPPPKGKRPDTWMIEPQLNNINNNEMIEDKGKDPYPNQAGDKDYLNNGRNLNRGHLFPCSHAHDLETKDSTFTLTNIVPQVVSFNGGSWNTMECKVRDKLKNCVDNNGKIKAYVVTGAVPSTNNKLNNRVNIPSLLWTAHWGENQWEENVKGKPKKTLPSKTLAELYEMLNQHYPGGGVQVFPDQCSIAQRLMDEDVHDHCVYDDDCVCSSVGIKGHYLPVILCSVLVMRML